MYNVQQKTQSNKIARQARLGFTILAIASIFVICFMATQAILTAVYGLPSFLNTSGSAYIGAGAGATAMMTESPQGQVIDSYVQNIKEQVCPTLEIEADYLECLQF
jgi:hypothetical protein